jgi:hypothetical protein
MALKNLSTGAMISLTTPWISEGNPERTILLRYPETKGLLGRIEGDQQALLDVQPRPNGRLAQVSDEQGTLDVTHDDLVRGVTGLLTHLALLATDAKEAQAFIELRETLFPQGVALVTRSYRDEAGEGALLRARLTPSLKKALKAIPVLQGTLADTVARYLEVADALGKLEDEKATIVGRADGPTPAALLAARNRWIRTVNAVIALLDIVAISEEEKTTVLVRFDKALRSTERGGADEDVSAPLAPTPAAGSVVATPTP